MVFYWEMNKFGLDSGNGEQQQRVDMERGEHNGHEQCPRPPL